MRVAVIGAGSWGSAVAWLLGNNGHEVTMWARRDDVVAGINERHVNPRYLTDVALPELIGATTSLRDALHGGAGSRTLVDAVVLATPSSAVASTAQAMSTYIGAGQAGKPVPLVLLSKGIENSTGRLFLDVLAEELGFGDRLAVLSGPNHAEEVVRGMPAGTLVASADKAVAELFQASLAAQTFRVYTSEDCIGVQLCGAAKNVFAIAAGLVAGMGLGDNLAALLMTRGLAETSRLVAASGGQQQTCMGLAGMGDLIVTCTSKHSRNRSFGVALAQGRTLKEYEEQTHMVVEGVYACRALPVLAQRLGVDMPISERVRDIVWDRSPVPEMLASLFDRPAKPEFY